MKELIIHKNEDGQRFDKFLMKYFKEAPSGFIYKMLRKKNITLNNKKSDGKDILVVGDCVKLFLADETISKFRGQQSYTSYPTTDLDIVYEDDNIIVINKPSGMLSQKAESNDVSINEYIIGYLLKTNQLTNEDLNTFKPSNCNRLDRNTSGLIVAGKTLKGIQIMSKCFKERTVEKYYLTVVNGMVDKSSHIKGYLFKDEKTNTVKVSTDDNGGSYIETRFEPIVSKDEYSLLKVELITGKTHQIRAHLASIKHSIIGDYKYGNKEINDYYKDNYGINNQLLHAYKLIFSHDIDELNIKAGKEITGNIPKEIRLFGEV